ncbi:hypothetical protein [Psychrobacter sp. FDAARGOS_221]|uniref:hypothetical protein n=1 Tax=Psychrobacter sp. FDAARGOS_221 TaxID=1975705 RepID=UPI000BB57F6B|nr:hypothetical protein [Psychrobacter sp. FDAARGOS_221]PNK59955.1 hypothetical protein A6J60_003025 [Psychrobacter sp. FDAARGOS_221]
MQNKNTVPKWLLVVIIAAVVSHLLLLLSSYHSKKQLQEQQEFYQLASEMKEELNLDIDIPEVEK